MMVELQQQLVLLQAADAGRAVVRKAMQQIFTSSGWIIKVAPSSPASGFPDLMEPKKVIFIGEDVCAGLIQLCV